MDVCTPKMPNFWNLNSYCLGHKVFSHIDIYVQNTEKCKKSNKKVDPEMAQPPHARPLCIVRNLWLYSQITLWLYSQELYSQILLATQFLAIQPAQAIQLAEKKAKILMAIQPTFSGYIARKFWLYSQNLLALQPETSGYIA